MTGSIKLNKPFIIGVAGGSGSGKTYFARELQKKIGADMSAVLYQDNFYFDQSKNFDFDGGSVNFDHPDAIEFSLLAQCLSELKAGKAAKIPVYDFATHARAEKLLTIEPKPIIIVDGILIFHTKEVRAQLDRLIYFETPEDVRFQRRLDRDVKERGRSPEGVRNQFYRQVKPMHDLFVEPSKRYADVIVGDEASFESALGACAGLARR